MSTERVLCGICRGESRYAAIGGELDCEACNRTGGFDHDIEDLALLKALRDALGSRGLAGAGTVGGRLGLNARQAPLDNVHDLVRDEAMRDWLDGDHTIDDDRPTRREAEADAREDERRAPGHEGLHFDPSTGAEW